MQNDHDPQDELSKAMKEVEKIAEKETKKEEEKQENTFMEQKQRQQSNIIAQIFGLVDALDLNVLEATLKYFKKELESGKFKYKYIEIEEMKTTDKIYQALLFFMVNRRTAILDYQNKLKILPPENNDQNPPEQMA